MHWPVNHRFSEFLKVEPPGQFHLSTAAKLTFAYSCLWPSSIAGERPVRTGSEDSKGSGVTLRFFPKRSLQAGWHPRPSNDRYGRGAVTGPRYENVS